MKTKICSKCKIEKLVSGFSKDKYNKDNLCVRCKACARQHRLANIEHERSRAKQYYKDTIEQKSQYYKNNIKHITTRRTKQSNGPAPASSYIKKLEVFEDVRLYSKNVEQLEVKCAYCGKWFIPTSTQVRNRLRAFAGLISSGTENRFYCSEACKGACPTYRQRKYWKGQNDNRLGTPREVDAWFRQYVLQYDGWTCQKCGATKDEDQELVLHVHHINGVAQQPMLQNDIDNAVTLCKDCHKEVHSQQGCTYWDYRRLKCNSDINDINTNQ